METRRSGTGGRQEGWYRGGDMYMHMYVDAKKSGPFPRPVLTHFYRACINFNRLPIFSDLSPAAIRKGHQLSNGLLGLLLESFLFTTLSQRMPMFRHYEEISMQMSPASYFIITQSFDRRIGAKDRCCRRKVAHEVAGTRLITLGSSTVP